MRSTTLIPILATLINAGLIKAHGSHGDEAAALEHAKRHAIDYEGLDMRGYAEKHMSQEHHIDSFDMESFFKLHDLNHDNILSIPEIEAIYGLHHPAAEKDLPSAYMESKRTVIVDKVLKALDTNGDRMVSLEEFLAGGEDPLPSFVNYPDLGHHYDEESEYFLHHEELYHSTPETQTDESYNHPEDIEHFARHEEIEAEEDARERDFEGLPSDASLETDREINDPLDSRPSPSSGQVPFTRPSTVRGKDRPARVEDGGDVPVVERVVDGLKKAKVVAEGMVGYGEQEFHRPRSSEEKLRRNTPYKYKFKNRNEF